MSAVKPVLSVKDLSLKIRGNLILDGVSFELEKRKITGLVGESGSGKSLTALSIMQLLPNGAATNGSIAFDGTQVLTASEEAMCDLRGDDIGMVFQEPMTALNPLKQIGEQVAEGIRIHAGVGHEEAEKRAIAILSRVGLPPEKYPLSRYPHELSGGQRQRVVIAMACAMKPKLLIADEPTTALDVIVQAKILDLLKELVSENDMALLLISHDLGVVAGLADDIVIMRQGKVMEAGPAIQVLQRQAHPYTAQLAKASTHIPKQTNIWKAPELSQPLVEVSNLICEYPGNRTSLFKRPTPFKAVDRVSWQMDKAEILGLVGESGCGKSTMARSLLGLIKPADGTIAFEGKVIGSPDGIARADIVQFVQTVFQDPYGSFNPRHVAERLVAEPLFTRTDLSKSDKRELVQEALNDVGLTSADGDKYPHEFSGGQRQRLAIARAIVNRPKLIIADEPVSALDVSIRAQILDLIIELREKLSVAWLFISHDLSVVQAICDNVMIMKDGNILESGNTKAVYAEAKNPYTRALIKAAPDLSNAIRLRSKS